MKFQPRPRFEALAVRGGAFFVQKVGFLGGSKVLQVPGGPWRPLEVPGGPGGRWRLLEGPGAALEPWRPLLDGLELRETPTCMDEAE